MLDNLASLHQLLASQMPVIGPTVVARSAIEIGSGVWWLMEPGIGARARVCRELALSLASARRAGQLAGEFRATGFDVSEAIKEAEQQEARVLQRIAGLGIAAPGGGYSPAIEGEQAPGATRGTAMMLRVVLPASVPGEAVYRTYSAVTHGEIYGLMNFTAPGVTSDGSQLLHWYLPPDVLDSTIQMAIMAFRESWRRINQVMGWGKLEGDLWEIKLSKIYTSPAPRTLSRMPGETPESADALRIWGLPAAAGRVPLGLVPATPALSLRGSLPPGCRPCPGLASRLTRWRPTAGNPGEAVARLS